MKFPTCVIQNFFNNPKDILKYIKTLKWYNPKPKDNWPGKRTENLWELNEELFKFVVNKSLSLYFNINTQIVRWKCSEIKFHKIKPKDLLKYKKQHTQIHRDNFELAGVIYLNENCFDENNGTTIYDDNKKEILRVSNYFNNAVFYDGSTLHGLTSFNKKDRLVLCVFIDGITVDEKN
jgi:hypothetical protein